MGELRDRPRGRWRVTRWLVSVVVLMIAGVWIGERLAFERQAWVADYEQLRGHMSLRYANLVWATSVGGVDPVELDRQTRAGLADAATDRQARRVLVRFIEAFDDGHLRVDRIRLSKRLAAWWRELGRDGEQQAGPLSSAPAMCGALGLVGDAGELGFGLAQMAGVSVLDGARNSIPAASFEHAGTRYGVVRIPSFSQDRYAGACQRAWARFGPTVGGECTDACAGDFLHRVVPNQILAEIAERVVSLRAENVDVLVVDISGNGGGTDWVEPATRIFTDRPLSCPRLGFIKDPHWSDRLRELEVEVSRDLAGASSGSDRELLLTASERLSGLVREATQACDLSALWTDGREAVSCSNLVEGEYYACGLFPYLPPGSLATAQSRTALYKGLAYEVVEGVYSGPLAIVIDSRTASAAEHFAAMLIDAEAATGVGEPTAGSGCGYTGGGTPAHLEHSGLKIAMPDCQRRRRDGTNELAGIAPDIAIAWDDAGDRRREQLLRGLAAVPH